MLLKTEDLNKRNQCDKFDESNMFGDIAQAQLCEKVIYCLKRWFIVWKSDLLFGKVICC